MGVIDNQKQDLNNQFIYVETALEFIADIEKCTSLSIVAEWLLSTHIIKHQKILIRTGDFELSEYQPTSKETQEFINPNSELETLIYRSYVEHDIDAQNTMNLLGFARKRFFYSLVNAGIEIPNHHLLKAQSYIPNGYDSDQSSDEYSYLIEQIHITENQNKELLKKVSALENLLNKYRNDSNEFKSISYDREEEFLETINILNQRIAELEANSIVSNNPDQLNLFDLITNETHAQHAPDLGHAVKLWLHLYHNNHNSNDSHTNRAIIWIKGNTGYTDMQTGGRQAMNRIREITTPFKEWGGQRNKNYKKI